jgi:membrane-associated phospholipid phosphatase
MWKLLITASLIIMLLLTLNISPAFAETAGPFRPVAEKTAETGLKPDTPYLAGYFFDTKQILISPIHWGKEEWFKASLLLGTTIVLYNNDPAIQNYFQEHRNSTTDGISRFAKAFGDYRVVIPSLALLYAYGITAGDEKAQQAALLSLESLIIAGGITCAFKLAGHRRRPYTNDPYDTWDGPGLAVNDDALSFPSVHSSTAFAVATVISSVYDGNRWVRYIAYSLAALTAFSRVNDNEHWCSDVFFGSAVGYYSAKTIVGLHQKEATNSIAMVPIIDGGKVGLSLSCRF